MIALIYNRLSCRGKTVGQLELLWRAIGGTTLDFENIVPYPTAIMIQTCDQESVIPSLIVPERDASNWELKHWGCMGNASHVHINAAQHKAEINFRTAIAPPTSVIKALADLFPEISFSLSCLRLDDMESRRISFRSMKRSRIAKMSQMRHQRLLEHFQRIGWKIKNS